MELFGHVLTFYMAMILNGGVSVKEANQLVREHSAKLCLTDAIRCQIVPEGENDKIVKAGRGYSHFTDGCSMVLPYGEKLKSFDSVKRTVITHGDGYCDRFADGPIDFGKFIKTNSSMFQYWNDAWGLCVLTHLMQDAATNILWQNRLCICDTKKDEVVYLKTGNTVDSKQFRKDKKLVNILYHQYLIENIREHDEQANIDQEWVDTYVCPSFREAYPPHMAENTCKCIMLDEKLFKPFYSVELDELWDVLMASGLINNSYDLLEEMEWLAQQAIASCNMLVNKFA